MESAIHQLQNEPIPVDAQAKVLMKTRGTQNRIWRPLLAGSTVAAACSLFLLWPAKRAMAWQDVVHNSTTAQRAYEATYERPERGGPLTKTSETWIDGVKFAVEGTLTRQWILDGEHVQYRSNGKRNFHRNWLGYGEVADAHSSSPQHDIDRFSIRNQLQNKLYKLLGEPVHQQLDGKDVQVYTFQTTARHNVYPPYRTRKCFVDPASGQIVRMEYLSDSGQVEEYHIIRYPASIPDSQFDPPTNGPRVFDLDKDAEALRAAMSPGIPLGHGITFRAAVTCPNGELMILWTGTPPNSDGSDYPTVPRRKVLRVYAPYQLSNGRWRLPKTSWYTFQGQPLCGVSILLDKPIGPKVDINLPIQVEDRSHPIRVKGEIKAYRSKAITIHPLHNIPTLEAMPYATLEEMRRVHDKLQ
jgi:hypothetical protein